MTAPAPSDSAPVANRDAAASSEYKPQPSAAMPKGTYAFVSLGCPKNLVDSERMLGLLQIDGYRLVPEPDGADFVVVNTCGFIERARDESFGAIDEALALKKRGQIGRAHV